MTYVELVASEVNTSIMTWTGSGRADLYQGDMHIMDGNIMVTEGGELRQARSGSVECKVSELHRRSVIVGCIMIASLFVLACQV
jgi:hypothetical protein